ncbi:MAG: hypothetical protein F7B17_07410 [Desulfurococcales archaeon]|nr:hypothetical protein [Desulfurococcales archaeon]
MTLEELYLAYPTAVVMGLIHGSDPGHGWIVSALYSLRSSGGVTRALVFTTILALGHFLSTLVVVGAVWILGTLASEYLAYIKFAAGALLLILATGELLEALREGRHVHNGEDSGKHFSGIWEAFRYAVLLGFAHEEEVALSAIVLAGANPLLLSVAYGAAVYVSMAAWTLATIALVSRAGRIEEALHSVSHILTPLIVAVIGVFILLDALGELRR